MTSRISRLAIIGGTLLTFVSVRPVESQELRCDPGDVEVRRLVFEGNQAFSNAELASAIVTTPSGWARRLLRLPAAVRRCLDRTELPNDRIRLIVFYRRRGFPDVTVDTAVTVAGSNQVEVRFRIHEGRSITLSTLAVAGADSVAGARQLTHDLPISAGERFDRERIDATRDTIGRRLRNSGYPEAQVENRYTVDAQNYLAWDTLVVRPGKLTRIGAVHINVSPFEKKPQQISNRIVGKILGIRTGQIYREQDLLDAQRRLYQTEAYQHVSLFPDSLSSDDGTLGISVTLLENAMHSARIGAGYGTLDCFRVSGELSNYNFLGGAQRLDLTGRLSKIGIGEPLSGARGLCATAIGDPYSNKLNYYTGATLRPPLFFGLRSVPTITVYTERVSEYKAYLRTTAIGGVASVLWQKWPKVPVTFAYSLDYGRTEAQPALFCAVFNVCDQEARERLQSTQRLAIVSTAITRDNTNSLISPTSGSVLRIEGRHASPAIFSDQSLQFNKFQGEASRYWGLGGGNVFAVRLRAGAVFGKNFGAALGFIPPQERLYAGGPTSVRGFNQNELGSAVYIAPHYDIIFPPPGTHGDTLFRADTVRTFKRSVPVGGNSLVVGNAEVRLRSPFLPDVLQWTLFTDAGDVWNRGQTYIFENLKLKITPGIQLGAFTPVGPVRVVVGYNPYRRPAGPLYYESSRQEGSGLPCVSPGNTIPVHAQTTTEGVLLIQSEGRCPSSFRPVAESGLRSRLTFNLAIGQAF